jgi:predicted TIM-barrel fold metal-dependent hydrolase
MATYEQINQVAKRLDLPEIPREAIANILGNNAARLLGLM